MAQPIISEETIWDMQSKAINLQMDDLVYIEQFLERKERKSTGSMKIFKREIFRFIYLIKPYSLATCTRENGFAFLEHLDSIISYKNTPLKYSTKWSNAMMIKAFFNDYSEHIASKHPNFINPITKAKYFPFQKPLEKTLLEREAYVEEHTYTISELKQILRRYYAKTQLTNDIPRQFHFYVLLVVIFTGCRIGEAVTLKRANINFEESYLTTGLVKNAQKNKRELVFYFPSVVKHFLRKALIISKSIDPHSEWLFIGRKTEKPLSAGFFRECKRQHKTIAKKQLSHTFRKTLTTFRLHDPVNPTTTHVEELLSNHVPQGIIRTFYDNYSLEQRKTDYFKHFPQAYKELVLFLEQFL